MHKTIIGVDLDEVLAELVEHILEYNGNMIGSKTIKKEEIIDYYIHKMDHVDLTYDEAVEWFRKPMFEDDGNYRVPVILGAKEKLLDLKEQGYKLVVLTARIEEMFGEYTRKWVYLNYPDIFDDIIFADHFHEKSREKSEICKEYGIEYMVEDNLDYALDLANSGIKTFLLEKPWNNWQEENHENIVKIKSWDELKI